MRALSLWQPWASAVALGLKRIETRHWSTGVRGLIAIHAAKRWTAEEQHWTEHFARLYDDRLREPPLGAIVAIAQLTACYPTTGLVDRISEQEKDFGNYAPGRFGFVLENIQPLTKPLPWRGAQGFFEVDADIVLGHPAPDAQGMLL